MGEGERDLKNILFPNSLIFRGNMFPTWTPIKA